MKKFICLECGGNLELSEDLTKGKCPYCLTEWILKEPLNDESFFKFQIATEYQKTYKFSDAKRNFEDVARQNPDFSEAWWGAFLADYGIEFGVNRIGEKVPTCHRTNIKSVYDSENYKNALMYADEKNKDRFTGLAQKIEDVRLQILEQVNDGENYDVFICFKATEVDDPTRRTIDYELGTSIYDSLTKKGYKVFFSPKTLLRVQEQNFEPYIYKALSTAKVMLLLCSNNKKVESAWVKNEWGRYLDMYNGKGLVPICGNRLEPFSPTSLPYDLQRLNAIIYDENVLENISTKVDTFFEDRIKQKNEFLEKERENALKLENERIKQELEEIKNALKNNISSQPTAVVNTSYDISTAIKRCYEFLNSKQFSKTIELVDNSLLFDNTNAELYYIKFLAQKNITKIEEITSLTDFYENDDSFINLVKFMHGELKQRIINHEKNILTQILSSQREFAENAEIKNNELIKFSYPNSQIKDIVTVGDIKTIKEKAFYQPLAGKSYNSLTILPSVEKLESCVFVGNLTNNIYLPSTISKFESNMFYANSKPNATLHFENSKAEVGFYKIGESGKYTPSGFALNTSYHIYKDNYDVKSPIIQKLDFILNNFSNLKDYYLKEKEEILKIIKNKEETLLEKENAKFIQEFQQSEIELPKIFELRKEFIKNAVIENGKLVDYNLDYEKYEVVYMTEDVLEIQSGLFDSHKDIKIVLPTSLKKIPKKCFVNIYNLELYVPNSIIEIEKEAIATYAFYGKRNLLLQFEDSYYKNGFATDWCHTSSFVKDIPKIKKECYIQNKLEYFKTINPDLYNNLLNEENNFKNELKQKVLEEEIKQKQLLEEKLKKLETLKYEGFEIEEDENGNYTLLKYNGNARKVVIPEIINYIAEKAFINYSSIFEIILPSSLKEIESYAFMNCSNLESIEIPESVDFINSYAFCGCENLKSIKFGKNLVTLENHIFKDCKNLTEITLDHISTIYDGAFENCIKLRKVTFNSIPYSLGSKIFFGCNKELIIEFKNNQSIDKTHWNKDWDIISNGFLGLGTKAKHN